MFFHRIKTFSSLPLSLILFAGVCFTCFFGLKIYQRFQVNPLSFSENPVSGEQIPEEQLPSRIIIPSLKIDLPVFPAKAAETQWEIFETGASYLLGSGIPGKNGNVVIYTHNKRHLFGPILWIKKGAEIKIENKKDESFTYYVLETKTVSPQQIEVLLPTSDSSLTLYTCSGFMDSKRFVVVAKLK